MKYQEANNETLKEAALSIKDKIGDSYDFVMEKILDVLEQRLDEVEFMAFCEEL